MRRLSIEDLDGWERRLDSGVKWVPYVALGVSLVLAILTDAFLPGPPIALTVVLTLVAAAWIFFWVNLHPAWSERRVLMGIYFVVLLGLIAALIACSPVFGFFAFAGYLNAVYALRGRMVVFGVVTTGALSSLSQIGGFPTLGSLPGVASYLVVAVFNIAIAGALSLLAWVTTEQAERRKRMIGQLNETNTKLETAMAENAGLHAQLLTQAREAGVLDERARMAGEIHDTIAQGLAGIITQLEAADQVEDQPADRRRHLDTAAGLARESLSEARRSVRNLQPEQLEGATLPEALAGVVQRWSDLHGLAAEITTTGTVRPMHPEIEGTLVRTAQEALTNVAKHAGASRVGLTLSYMEDQVTLDVRDDGVGFEPAETVASGDGGFGLKAMRQRLQRIAGLLEVESEPGGGTAISASVPAIPAGSVA
ncbi:sensor histidine kinase [Rugosimonospora africana]|nr:sensor histidine kinase [Rugosimonospora africana]